MCCVLINSSLLRALIIWPHHVDCFASAQDNSVKQHNSENCRPLQLGNQRPLPQGHGSRLWVQRCIRQILKSAPPSSLLGGNRCFLCCLLFPDHCATCSRSRVCLIVTWGPSLPGFHPSLAYSSSFPQFLFFFFSQHYRETLSTVVVM